MSTTPDRKRLRVFRALTLGFPLIFFVLLEASLRLFGVGPNLDLFVPLDPAIAGPGYLRTNPDVALRYFSHVGRVPRPVNDVFLENKPPNGYRVFMIGGSTVAGFPYPENVIASRILDRRLSDAFPDRDIEVVNLGIAAINSFALLDFVDEILDQGPDAVLIYAGHNEFYGALGSASTESLGNSRRVVHAYLSLLRLASVRVMRDAILGLIARERASGDAAYERDYPTLMSRMIAEPVPYGGEAYRSGERNFRQNLDEILSRLTGAGVPVLLADLVSNIRDLPPLDSVEAGRSEALAVYEEALDLDRAGEYESARQAYERAKDLDGLRFRASEEFNAIIRDLGRRKGVALVPMEASFQAASPNGLIGSTLMLEHLHPNAEGHLLMADAFFRAMRDNGLISEDWSDSLQPATWYAEHWPVTELDLALGRLRVLDLMDYWPFRPRGNPGDAFDRFQPRSPAEEAAYGVARDELDYVQAHIDLAGIYAAEGDTEKADREYEALAAASPLDLR